MLQVNELGGGHDLDRAGVRQRPRAPIVLPGNPPLPTQQALEAGVFLRPAIGIARFVARQLD